MKRDPRKPAFITFTGVDRAELLPGMIELTAMYPIEWGILLDPGTGRQSVVSWRR